MHSILFITVKHYVYLHHGLFCQVILNTKYERRYAPSLHIFKTNNTKSDGVIDMPVYVFFFYIDHINMLYKCIQIYWDGLYCKQKERSSTHRLRL